MQDSSAIRFLLASSRYKYFSKRLAFRSADALQYGIKALRGRRLARRLNTLELIRMCPWETEALFALCRHAKKGILEIGRCKGGSTLTMAVANQRVKIVSIDIAPANDDRLSRLLGEFAASDRVALVTGDANTVELSDLQGFSDFQYDFLFIDGDHSYQQCLADIHRWYPGLAPGGLMVFHDAYSSPDNQVLEAIFTFIQSATCNVIIPPSLFGRVYDNKYGSICAISKPFP